MPPMRCSKQPTASGKASICRTICTTIGQRPGARSFGDSGPSCSLSWRGGGSERGEEHGAEAALQNLLTADPTDEQAARELMLLLGAARPAYRCTQGVSATRRGAAA